MKILLAVASKTIPRYCCGSLFIVILNQDSYGSWAHHKNNIKFICNLI